MNPEPDTAAPDFLTLVDRLLDAMRAAGDGSNLDEPNRAIWAAFSRTHGRDLIRTLRIARDVARLEADGIAPWTAYELVGERRGLSREAVYRRLCDTQSDTPRASVGFLYRLIEQQTEDTRMASNRPLPGDLTVTGMDQKSLITYLQNVTDLVNELKADSEATVLALDGVLAKLDADAGVTDTNYEAVHGVGGSGAALPPPLTNSTDLTLNRG